MKKSYLIIVYTLLKLVVSFIVVRWVTVYFSPTINSVNFFNLPSQKLYYYNDIIQFCISTLVTGNIVFARKKGEVRLLLVTPLLVLVFQIVLMVFFNQRVPSWLHSPSFIP